VDFARVHQSSTRGDPECFATRGCEDLVQQGCWQLLSGSVRSLASTVYAYYGLEAQQKMKDL